MRHVRGCACAPPSGGACAARTTSHTWKTSSARRHRADRPVLVQQRTTSRTDSTPTVSPVIEHDQMAKPAADHRRGGLLQRPVGRGEDDVAREVLGDQLTVGVLTRAEREQDVALGDDPGTGPSGSMTTAAPTSRSDISRATARSVCPGPTVRTVGLIPSRTSMTGLLPAQASDKTSTRTLQRLPQCSTAGVLGQGPPPPPVRIGIRPPNIASARGTRITPRDGGDRSDQCFGSSGRMACQRWAHCARGRPHA